MAYSARARRDTRTPHISIGSVSHYFGHLSVAAIRLTAPVAVGERIHILGHTTDVVQTVDSIEIEHRSVERAGPGDDAAISVTDHVRERDLIFREA